VVYPVGSSMVYLSPHTRYSLVFGIKLFTDCSHRRVPAERDSKDRRDRQQAETALAEKWDTTGTKVPRPTDLQPQRFDESAYARTSDAVTRSAARP
jgi:hypothetical protein